MHAHIHRLLKCMECGGKTDIGLAVLIEAKTETITTADAEAKTETNAETD